MDTRVPRLAEPLVEGALRSSPVVVVTGARQTGKSTLTEAFEKRRFVSLDDLDSLDRARSSPQALVDSTESLTIDEIQRAPELLLAIKRAVDADRRRRPGRFLLTGSANLLLMKGVSESLAGRATPLTLGPMTRQEVLGHGRSGEWSAFFETKERDWPALVRGTDPRHPKEEWARAVRRGGYPVPALHLTSEADRSRWFAGYAQTYLERDLRELSAVESLVDFRRLMRAACLRIGSIVNQTELGRDIGLPQSTVHRHLALLEISYALARLPAYTRNRTSRLIRTPKLYWNDPALALHLSGEWDQPPRGAHFENLVLSDLLAWSRSLLEGPQVMFWRTSTGTEVDFVVEWRGRLLPIEVKSTRRPVAKDASGLRSFRDEYGRESLPGLLLHTGDDSFWLAEGILATPWWRVL